MECREQGITLKGLRGKYAGLARTLYIWCMYGIFGKEITEYTVIYNVYVQFWPTLEICAGKAATATSKRKNLTSSL
jgi:hypothetical protein